MIIAGLLMYFGAMLIPVIYLLATRGRGSERRPMLIGTGLQIFWSLLVWGFVYYNWQAGYTEYYWGWGLLVPVNAIGLIYYLIFCGIHWAKQRE